MPAGKITGDEARGDLLRPRGAGGAHPHRAQADRAWAALEDGNPYTFIECVPNIYPVKGHATPVTPGQEITFEVPDMYGRPWAKNWEKYYEQGMKRPDADEGLFNFDKPAAPARKP